MERFGFSIEQRQQHAARMHRAGVPLVSGADSGIDSGKPHGVLPAAVTQSAGGGVPTDEALATATPLAADACGLAGRKGRLRRGLDAHLLLVSGDPFTDLAALSRPVAAGGGPVGEHRSPNRTRMNRKVRFDCKGAVMHDNAENAAEEPTEPEPYDEEAEPGYDEDEAAYEEDAYAADPAAVRADPDVFLDVPLLKVDEIDLDVEDLRAHVSLQAEVLDLLKLNVGADVSLGRVHLGISGVEAQAQLRVRLDNVATIINRVLTTLDRNPEILHELARGVGSAVQDVGSGARVAVGELGTGAGAAVQDVGRGAGAAVQDVGRGAGAAVQDVGQGVGSAAVDVGRGAGRAVEDVGGGAGRAVQDVGGSAGRAVGDVGSGVGRTAEEVGGGADRAVGGVGGAAQRTVGDVGGAAGRVAAGVADASTAAAGTVGEETVGATGKAARKTAGGPARRRSELAGRRTASKAADEQPDEAPPAEMGTRPRRKRTEDGKPTPRPRRRATGEAEEPP
ncbi:amidohydrolase family protein [Streptomyces sp. NPDC029006]|uniref:amidohydrolase family protein n=1 Tax=Streptomyces sp. NPDC029006 TaxID=3155467 RepID=UPI0033ED4421